jgi:hypothetical protein
MIVVESGSTKLNTWITEERNVYEDYKRAFGQEPPMISGVAIMTDIDNTEESAEAYYEDIVFKQRLSDSTHRSGLSRHKQGTDPVLSITSRTDPP